MEMDGTHLAGTKMRNSKSVKSIVLSAMAFLAVLSTISLFYPIFHLLVIAYVITFIAIVIWGVSGEKR